MWTRQGTVSLENNSKKVFGSGTPWAANGKTRPGDEIILPNSARHEVESVQSNTELTLVEPYMGATASGQSYSLLHIGMLPAEAALALGNLQSKYLTTVVQWYEWQTSSADTVSLTNPATGITAQVKPLAKFLASLGDGSADAVFKSLTVTTSAANVATFTGGTNAYADFSDGVGNFRIQLLSNVPRIGSSTNHPLEFVTNNTTRATLDTAGNFAIAGAPYAWGGMAKAFQTKGAALWSLTNDLFLNANSYWAGTGYVYSGDGFASDYYQQDGSHYWRTAPSGTAGQPVVFTQAMWLDPTGHLNLPHNIYVGDSSHHTPQISSGSGSASLCLGINGVEKTRIDTSGNWLAGATSGSCHTIKKAVTSNAGELVLRCEGNGAGLVVYGVGSTYGSSANSAVKMGVDQVTGRSLSTPGTITTSGEDYAEYERNNGPTISKGAVVGFKADGSLTLLYSDAIRFGVKSTNPSYVGGDTWGAESIVGKRPEQPIYEAPIYEGAQKPGPEPTAPLLVLPSEPQQQDGETDETFAVRVAQWKEARAAATAAHETATVEYADALAQWNAALSLWKSDDAAYQIQVADALAAHDAAVEQYKSALAEFEAALEAERQKVDRVAYSGKVPVNVTGATPGGYIIAAEGDDGEIVGQYVADPDFAQYKRAVGRVNRILDDGRAEVAVMVH